MVPRLLCCTVAFVLGLGAAVPAAGHAGSTPPAAYRLDVPIGLAADQAWLHDGFIPMPGNVFQARLRLAGHLYAAASLGLETAIYPRPPIELADVNTVLFCAGLGAGLWHAPGPRVTLLAGARADVFYGMNLPDFDDTLAVRDSTGTRAGPSAAVAVTVGHVRGLPVAVEAQIAWFYYFHMDRPRDWLDGVHAGLFITSTFAPR